MNLLRAIHGCCIHARRARVLANWLSDLLPPDATTVLDVGCGDGLIARQILARHSHLQVNGIDVVVRPQPHIPVARFDGAHIPHPAVAFDVVLLVDVLHHADDPLTLLQEAGRVARQAVLVKDHYCDGFLAGPTLRFMDRVGNAGRGVALPFNYWSAQQWAAAFTRLNLQATARVEHLNLYPFPINCLFERGLHFMVRLESNPAASSAAGAKSPKKTL